MGFWDDVKKTVKDYREEKTRKLTQAEKDLAWDVFWETVPYSRVRIGDSLGWGGRPWMETVDREGFRTGDNYILHLGKVGFQDATTHALIPNIGPARETFIHEMTHVWQSYHGTWVFTRSAPHQIYAEATGADVYSAEVGLEWSDYNVEQQANLVEDWFRGGMSTEVVLYEYIRDHIRNCGCE